MITHQGGDQSAFAHSPALPDGDATTALVLRAQAGDDDAFEALVSTFQQSLLAVAHRFAHNPDDAQDIVQEAWSRIARHLGDLRDAPRFRAWALRIARHCSIDFLRAHRTERTRSVSADAEAFDNIRDFRQVPPDESIIASEAEAELKAALALLPAADRALLDLREVEELPYTEVARRLGITVGAAQVRAFRARRRLQRLLALAIQDLGCAVTEDELALLLNHKARPAQSSMLWRHIATCDHCVYRLRLLKAEMANRRPAA
jgi:RNA polymerase sigma-70 factor (ECF subfamily)